MESARRKEMIMVGSYMIISSIVDGMFGLEGFQNLATNFIIIMGILSLKSLLFTKEEQESWEKRSIRAAICNATTGGNIGGVLIIISGACMKGCIDINNILVAVLLMLIAKISYDVGNKCYYKRA